ncbi:MAG: DNA polymerase III subunit gamma/tau [Microbacterium sp.]|uniref:DNA polymerase III subunit gamma/tau n=1 Tax=Microbacterium sp. TaxID=51671 RepID=UPI0039E3A7E2
MARRDDDAFSWGDDDPTLDDGIDRADDEDEGADASVAPTELPPARPGSTVTATVTAADGTVTTREVVHPHTDDRRKPRAKRDAPAKPAPLGNVALVSLGLLGGIYLLFAVGWFISGSRLQAYAILYAIEPIGYVVAWVLATLAPAVWFAAVLFFGRRRPVWLRILLLVLGVLVLVPWPFLTIGATS